MYKTPANNLPERNSRVLWIRFWALGDVLQSAAEAMLFKERFPDVHLSFLVQPEYADIIKEQPWCDNVIPAYKSPFKEFKRTLKLVREGNFDWIISQNHGGKTAIISLFSGVKNRVGKTLLPFFYTETLNNFWVRSAINNKERIKPSLIASKENVAWAMDHLSTLPERRLFAIIGASNECKMWPLGNWIEFLVSVLKDGWGVVLIGNGDKEIDFANKLQLTLGHKNIKNTVGTLTLVQLLSIASVCTTAVGNDTGTLHLASLSGLPTIGLADYDQFEWIGLTMPWFTGLSAADKPRNRKNSVRGRDASILAKINPQKVLKVFHDIGKLDVMSIIQITALVQSYCGRTRIIPTLESCKLQNYPYKDLVIADDASNDGSTIAIIENWLKDNAQYFTNVLFIKNSQNLGIVKNYHNAALRSQGDVIIPLGQGDTYYSRETFTRIANEIKKQRKENLSDPLVWLGYYKSYEIAPEWKEVNDHLLAYPVSMSLLEKSPDIALIKLLEGNFIGAPSFVYNKNYFQEGIFPIPDAIKDLEDYAMSVWMLVKDHHFSYLPLFVRWYEKGTGLSASRNVRHLTSLKKVYDFVEEITRTYPKLNKLANESRKLNQIRSINNLIEREVKKIFFHLSRILMHPVEMIKARVFSVRKKYFMKVNSPDIIKHIELQSGKSFDKDFFI